jgi:hypothetical protein
MSNVIVKQKDREAKTGSSDVKIVGTVVRKYYSEEKAFAALIVATGARSPKSNYPRVFFFGDDAKNADKNIEVKGNKGPCVEITATVRTKKKILEAGAKPIFLHSIIGDSLSLAKTQLEAVGASGGTKPIPDENFVHIEGSIVHIFDFEKGVVLTFAVNHGNSRSFPKVTCFGTHAEFARGLEEGDVVVAAGMIQTAKKQGKDGNPVFYESVVCTDIDKSSEAAGKDKADKADKKVSRA